MKTIPHKVMMGFETDKRIARDFNSKRMTETVGGKTCNFRSKLEFRVAKYLQLLKDTGHIKDWAFEQTNFVFPDDEYLVDFDVLENDGSFYYIEAKGHPDERARRKLRLLNKYRPEVKIMMVFQNKKDAAKLGLAGRKYCWRVCLLNELTKGII
jgi:hypothetical protein